MSFLILTGWIFIGVVAVSVIWILSQQASRNPDRDSKIVTQNLDYSILGQRPEIITEEDPEDP